MRATPASWFLGIVVGLGLAPASHVLAGPAPEAWSVFRHGGDGAVNDLGDARPKPRGDAARDMPLSVVEIPAAPLPGIGPPGRVHHALSMRFGAAERAMRSWGVDATDCRLQFRVPTKIAQSGGGISIDAMAQLRFGCRF